MTKDKKYFQAVAVMTGYTIGVGMLSLPYLFHKAGILTFFFFFFLLVPLQYLIHLIYANIIIVTHGYHRLPGYAEIYLGKKSKGIVFFAKIFGNFGALLAYIITTGIFLNELLHPIFGGNEVFYSSFLFLLEAIIVFFGISMIARAELFMTSFMLFVVLLMVFKCFSQIDINNYTSVDFKYFLLPFGAVLFSLDGSGSLPALVKILKKDKAKVKSAIRLSMFLSIFVTITFTLIIWGVTGDFVTEDSLKGLNAVIGGSIVSLALIFGILSQITSFLGVAEEIQETFSWDFKVNKNLAWLLAFVVPYSFYLMGVRNLAEVITFIGAVSGGISGIILVFIFKKLQNKKNVLIIFKKNNYKFIINLLLSLFSVGIIYQIFYYL